MADTKKSAEPTANEISVAILEMFGMLVLLDDSENPFQADVKRVIEKFDTPELRTSLSRRLFHPELYIPATPSSS